MTKQNMVISYWLLVSNFSIKRYFQLADILNKLKKCLMKFDLVYYFVFGILLMLD